MTPAERAYLHLETGANVPYGRVIAAHQEFEKLLTEVAHDVSPTTDVRWLQVAVAEATRLRFRVTPDMSNDALTPTIAHAIVDAVAMGAEELAREAIAPPHFNFTALRATQHLAGFSAELGSIAIRNGSHGAELDDVVAANVSAVIPVSYVDYGSIEGRLEALNIHAKSRYFRLYDGIARRGIRCNFGTRIDIDTVRGAVGHRVAAYGAVTYLADGVAVECQVDDLDVFPPDADLPGVDDVYGILSGRR